MILNRCFIGNPILRKKAAKITVFDMNLIRLAEDMIETMLASDGVGLAAPQIGKSIQLAIVDPEPSKGGLTRLILVNPEIHAIGDKTEVAEEGCLSVPGIYAKVKRAYSVRVKAQDLNGKPLDFEAHGFLARIIQHETDHLNGILFVDKVLPKEKERVEKELKEFAKVHAV